MSHSKRRTAGSVAALAAGACLALPSIASAQCVTPVRDGSFEGQPRRSVAAPWTAEGGAGISHVRELSFSGVNSAWARNTRGWSALRQRVHLTAGYLHRLSAAVRTSSNVRAGYLGFRDANQRPVGAMKFGRQSAYSTLEVSYRPTRTGYYYVFAGLWALGEDSWIRVDDVRLTAPCDDNPGQPG